ncbi:MAG: putative metal-binding motif-containing protein [Bacteroidales bacterium]|nr:putative metal-binding motif-containing protein [Bacteroidales bacterium]
MITMVMEQTTIFTRVAQTGVSTNGDCNDSHPYVHPNAPEICGNSLDDNCNGIFDEAGCQ